MGRKNDLKTEPNMGGLSRTVATHLPYLFKDEHEQMMVVMVIHHTIHHCTNSDSLVESSTLILMMNTMMMMMVEHPVLDWLGRTQLEAERIQWWQLASLDNPRL